MNTSSTRQSTRSHTTRTGAILLAAGCTVGAAQTAEAQDFFGMPLPADVLAIRPVGISGSGDGIVIPYKAVNERGVQVYESAGLWNAGTFFEMPAQIGPNGEYQDVVNVQYRKGLARADVIPGVDIIVKTKPGNKAAVWDTRDDDVGVVFDLPNSLTAVSWPNSLSGNGSIIGGAVHGDLDGQGVSRSAAVWRDFGAAELLPVPAGTRFSEVWGVSGDGGKACGAISERGMPSDQPKIKPPTSKGMIWRPSGYTVVEAAVAGPDATSLAFTAMSDDSTFALATISTTRSNSKGGLYFDDTGTFTLLDGGDINQDGTIDGSDDHDSAVYAFSADASLLGGSITLMSGEELGALWILNPERVLEYHDVATYLRHIGGTGMDGDIDGWTLRTVTGISADGNTITGWGTNPSGQTTGWVATVPTPGALALLAAGGFMVARRRRA